MDKIYNYTTPTITFDSFQTVSPSDFSEAYLTIKQCGSIILEKELSDMTVTDTSIAYSMTQEESALLGHKRAKIELTWKTTSGKRGVSPEYEVLGVAVQKSEVI